MNYSTLIWLFRKPIPATLCDALYRYGAIMREKQKSMEIPTLLGIGIDETPLIVDLGKIGAILVGGAPESGKSAFLQSLAWVMSKWNPGLFVTLLNCKNDAVEDKFFDEKKSCRGIAAALEHLNYLCSIIEERLHNRDCSMEQEVCIIDDFEFLTCYNPQIIHKLQYITSRGPEVKIYSILASAKMTQNNFSDTLKSNCPMHISLCQNSESNSSVILDNDIATHLVNSGDMIISYGEETVFAQGFIPEIELELEKDLYMVNDKYYWR